MSIYAQHVFKSNLVLMGHISPPFLPSPHNQAYQGNFCYKQHFKIIA